MKKENAADKTNSNAMNQVRRAALKKNMQTLIGSLLDKSNRKFLIASLAFHILVMVVALVHWQSREPVKPIEIPKSISVRAATPAELEAIKRIETRKVEKINAENRKKAEERKKKKLAEKRKQEAKKKRELEKAKAEKKRKQKLEAEKKRKALALKKQKEEADKKEAKRLEELRKEELRKEELRQEKLRQKVEEAKRAAEKKRQEQKLADKISRIAEQREKQKEIESAKNKALLEQQLSELDYYMNVIRSRIEGRWKVPPRTKGLRVVLQIKLASSGDLVSVSIKKSSGVAAFDNSATHAVNNVGAFPVPQDKALFDKSFRIFSMRFISPDDGL